MLFERRFHPGLADGSITATFRRWSRPRVKPGGRYRVGTVGLVEVDTVARVRADAISTRDARRTGFASREELLAYLAKRSPLAEDAELFCVAFHFVGPLPPKLHDPPRTLPPEALAELETRLERMDRLSRHGSWTRETLALIDRFPRTAAARLAARLGRETQPFKTDVRKLKRLGLTVSHEVGYELSLRGRALLERLRGSKSPSVSRDPSGRSGAGAGIRTRTPRPGKGGRGR